MLLTKVQRHVRFKQYVNDHSRCGHVGLLFTAFATSCHTSLVGGCSQHQRLTVTAVVRCICRRPHTAFEPVGHTEHRQVQQCCIGVICHSRRRVVTGYASTAGNFPRRADTFAQPKSTVLVGDDELPKVSVSSSSRHRVAGMSVASEHLFSKAGNVITKNEIVLLRQRFTQ